MKSQEITTPRRPWVSRPAPSVYPSIQALSIYGYVIDMILRVREVSGLAKAWLMHLPKESGNLVKDGVATKPSSSRIPSQVLLKHLGKSPGVQG